MLLSLLHGSLPSSVLLHLLVLVHLYCCLTEMTYRTMILLMMEDSAGEESKQPSLPVCWMQKGILITTLQPAHRQHTNSSACRAARVCSQKQVLQLLQQDSYAAFGWSQVHAADCDQHSKTALLYEVVLKQQSAMVPTCVSFNMYVVSLSLQISVLAILIVCCFIWIGGGCCLGPHAALW